jgi:NTE family protein
LGAGGVTGQAYHSGVLAALEDEFGWDPRTADVIVGTSAGSITGALLRSGVPSSDLAAWTLRAPQFEPFETRHLLGRPPQLPGLDMLQRAIVRPWHFRPLAAALALTAPGRTSLVDQLASLREVEGRAWPERDLWICAVRRRDGRRVVFGRPGTAPAPLHLAIAASCAVPGYFAPVEIGDHTYVDGGAHSPTNAAILRQRALDLVILVAPMSGPAPRIPTNLAGALRRHAGRLLARETAALRAVGTTVVTFRPGWREQDAMGDDFMCRDRVERIVRPAFLAAGEYAARPDIRAALTALSS